MDLCCSVCKAITGSSEGLASLDGGNGFEHHKWGELIDSAHRGCPLCKSVVQRVNLKDPISTDKPHDQFRNCSDAQVFVRAIWDQRTIDKEEDGKPTLFGNRKLRKLEFQVSVPSSTLEVAFDVEAAADDPAASHVARKTELKEFNDNVSLALRKSVIDCLVDHVMDECPGKKTGQLPRRVLDVGAVRSDETVDEDGPVRLKESKEGEKAIYTTLSYCWGDAKYQLTTTKATLSSRLIGLPPMRELPKTIADAVKVTRHLGVQYLWVDSLCIIQDDEVDKLEQIDMMSEIYRDSFVTIAASSASNVSEGFLRTSKPLKTIAKLPLLLDKVKRNQKGTIYLRGDWTKVSISDEPLYSRAWTFQETVLSPRVLDFNTYNSVHMCSDQDYPSLFSGHSTRDHQWPGSGIFKNIHRLESSKMFQALSFMHSRYIFRAGEFDRGTFGMWREIIHHYSSRRLSLPNDRLPALSGIAKRLTPYGGDYVAGLWKKSLVHHLGWEHSIMKGWPQNNPKESSSYGYNQTGDTDPTERRPLPTWSWASVPYGVFVAPLLEADTTFVDCQITPVSDLNPHGQVQSGILSIRARVFNYSDLPLEPVIVHDGSSSSLDRYQASIRLDHKEPVPGGKEKETLRFMYLGSRSHYNEEYGPKLEESPDARTFLVIRKAAGTLHYRRIGIFHIPETHHIVQSGQFAMFTDSAQPEVVSIE